MPIDYKKYPKNWKTEIRPAIMRRARYRCEFCGVNNYAVVCKTQKCNGEIVEMFEGSSYQESKQIADEYNHILIEHHYVIVLTIAHLDHNINNNDPSNLRALCQRCHLRYDAKEKVRRRKLKYP